MNKQRFAVKKLLTLVASLWMGLAAYHSVAMAPTEEAIAERIKPVAKVCVAGEECEGAQTSVVAAAPAAASGPRTGDAIYASACKTCHDAGVAGAPKLGDVAAWAPRIEKGMDTLVNHAINGFNVVMPARGTCMDCSDDELKATVEYMVSQSQ